MKTLRAIASLILASIVLFAAVGVTVNSHVCGGHVQSTALFIKATPCPAMQKACNGTAHHAKMKGCCDDRSIVFKAKETVGEIGAATQGAPAFHFITFIQPVLYSLVHSEMAVATLACAHYKPPLPERDIVVLVQTFLI